MRILTEKQKAEAKERHHKWYLKNREKVLAKQKKYYSNNSQNIKEYHKEYVNTPMGRAQRQVQQYRRMDIRNGFGNVIDFDAKWMVENIYTKSCSHCDETDWHKLGCNRFDNTKPHIKDNVEPCCFDCNIKLWRKEQKDKQPN